MSVSFVISSDRMFVILLVRLYFRGFGRSFGHSFSKLSHSFLCSFINLFVCSFGCGFVGSSMHPLGGGPRVVVSTAAFHARVRGSFPGLGDLKEAKMFLPHPLVKLSIVGSLRDREVAYSASDLQGLKFESCVWRAVSSHTSHHPQEVLLAQFSLYVHKSGLKPDSFHFSMSPFLICLCIGSFVFSSLLYSLAHSFACLWGRSFGN